ncbi:hypothetical protein GGI18_004428, partial [Coemansia linderi]
VDQLSKENSELRARLDTIEHALAASEQSTLWSEQKTDEGALLYSDDVEPLSTKRLDEISQSNGAKSAWSDLRHLYPPGRSAFAPLSECDDIDEALSQAATMSAYGAELLRIALS